MFNKIYISNQQDRLVPYEKTVHNHHAPTEQTAKYLDELREEAKENIVQRYLIEMSIGDFDLSPVGVFIFNDMANWQYTIELRAEGEFLGSFLIGKNQLLDDPLKVISTAVREKLVEVIAGKLIVSCAGAMDEQGMFRRF